MTRQQAAEMIKEYLVQNCIDAKWVECLRLCLPLLATEPQTSKNSQTYLDKLKQAYPLVSLNDDGVPYICVRHLGYDIACDGRDCHACWNSPIVK